MNGARNITVGDTSTNKSCDMGLGENSTAEVIQPPSGGNRSIPGTWKKNSLLY